MMRRTKYFQGDIKEVQSKVLEIFKYIAIICEENNIRYFAIAGTAIGGVRHGGFIPWDDDIDIAMPRNDYNEFKKIMKSHTASSHYRFDDCIEHPTLGSVIGRVYDELTTNISCATVGRYSKYTGIYVDVMPLDGVPSNDFLFRIYMIHLNFYKRLLQAKCLKDAKYSNDRFIRKTIKIVAGKMASVIPHTFLIKRYRKLANKYPFDNPKTKYLSRTWGLGTHDGMKAWSRYLREDFSDYIDFPFEDTTIRLPKGYDRYLSSLYPNYMTLPPKDKQKPHHHNGILDPGHSYKFYIAKDQKGVIGYTAGCYDMFHIGHMNVLRNAKKKCDYLVVGVNSDEAMYSYKKKYPIISAEERMEIVRNIKCVDEVVEATDTDKMKAYKKHKFDVIFVGDDHKGESKWNELERKLEKYGSKVHYLPHTDGTSSTLLREVLCGKIAKKG
ncbi:hypothetical protein FACS189431_0330 [Alphaproteobacteria bacterium]|nr:hypothetical protein FACS189431_0330 [Alphaproteobacteria bacterium]